MVGVVDENISVHREHDSELSLRRIKKEEDA